MANFETNEFIVNHHGADGKYSLNFSTNNSSLLIFSYFINSLLILNRI